LDTTLDSGEGAPALKVSAVGQGNSGGLSNLELGFWMYIVAPADGILDLDFMATAPAPSTIVTMGFKPITANAVFPVPNWVRGVRVHSATNTAEKMLPGPLPQPNANPSERGCRFRGRSRGSGRREGQLSEA
jgi:hypothetical protein